MIRFTIVAHFKANNVHMPVRLHLINLLFAGLIVVLATIFSTITCAIHVIVSLNDPRPWYLCRILVGIWYINRDTTLEPSSILPFHLGHCYLQQEDHQQVDCGSHCPYPVVGAHDSKSLHPASIRI